MRVWIECGTREPSGDDVGKVVHSRSGDNGLRRAGREEEAGRQGGRRIRIVQVGWGKARENGPSNRGTEDTLEIWSPRNGAPGRRIHCSTTEAILDQLNHWDRRNTTAHPDPRIKRNKALRQGRRRLI
ncbi:Meiotically upregulated protein [Trichinella spiralis]|uniref:Meiotically upregulated protein n=1 Tax=Trichinella spiralis TaxID=6334 RepID=A0ABR3KZ96_TRISP